MFDWTITTWSNTKMTTSWKDWHEDCKVKASGTSISSMLNSKMLKYGLLSPGERAFNNILVSFPAPSIIDDGVVYLQARVKFMDLKVFVLALDTRDNKLLGAVEFATKRVRGASVVYFPSNIGKYIDPEDRVMAIPEGGENDSNWEELSKYEDAPDMTSVLLMEHFSQASNFNIK
ncbi:hypothetical protein PVAP13_7KG323432 [Panicum virgatum]|uniref:Uncharacterized protein n=1 Tax=Panicum virgatum TaxID=38727 RepID=A0A8T0QPC1_PANVG|nr:hypothetical protein PVAP13_7KG323432 [Panicum virgatum]